MAETANALAQRLAQRIGEANAEITRLEQALQALDLSKAGSGRREADRPSKLRRVRRSRRRKRLPASEREGQVRAVVAMNPGISVARLAREIAVSPPRAHQLVKVLSDRGELSKRDGGLFTGS